MPRLGLKINPTEMNNLRRHIMMQQGSTSQIEGIILSAGNLIETGYTPTSYNQDIIIDMQRKIDIRNSYTPAVGFQQVVGGLWRALGVKFYNQFSTWIMLYYNQFYNFNENYARNIYELYLTDNFGKITVNSQEMYSVQNPTKLYTGLPFNISGYQGDFILFRLTIKEDNVLVHDFIPYYNPDSDQYGIFDLVTNSFKGNVGTGTITPYQP